ncbi:uncharacterized protein DUF4145 [Nitrosomonas oligotropha]|uniref:Uncharacterized protein DUF4145 n=1 Tax=Nitrosomonas oligotropha TaxID=42354 RepID=A0A2T5HY11_9PROT|nr:DUF4145 domain-containing protein [Nitrosomonas oligotropha]PTQ76469.1 uncharacterized protein DUF4145 [Nitrosomonas oligotropha]
MDMPKLNDKEFQCSHCQVIAQQIWFNKETISQSVPKLITHLYFDYRSNINEYQQRAVSNFLEHIDQIFLNSIQYHIPKDYSVATCLNCKKSSLWIKEEMVFPRKTFLPSPNDDMTDEIKDLYREAATIFSDSPKGATALLRLALQKLLKQLGKKGDNINNDIGELVSEGLSPTIQKALDLVRVVGNNAVHPGQIDLNDGSDIAKKLFHLLNFIANELISKPKELEILYSEVVPDDTKGHIQKRDKK